MRKLVATLALLAAVGFFSAPVAAATVVEIRLTDEVIHQVSAEYIIDGIRHAEVIDADAILLWLHTPGGLESQMREIVDSISTSTVPVVVYVAPTGSRAASAGFFILLASDIAVMAPGTTTGAASPVLMGGGEAGETMKKKIMSDAAAYLRSFASKRGRNPEVAELAVTEAKSFTDQEALEAGLIDAVCDSAQQILEKFDGRTITRFDGSTKTLALAGATFQPWEMTRRQRFLAWLSDPTMLFLFIVFGALGLYVEFNNPGTIFPGVVGGICVVLAMFSMHLLPVNYAAVLLILLAVAFFILEAIFTSHGVLAAGGIAAMVIGAMMLIDSPPIPEMRVRLELALAVAVPFAVLAVLFLRLMLKSRRWAVATGKEELVGATGEVRQEIGGNGAKGLVMISGELWRATAPAKVAVGQVVRVLSVEGLILRVEPVDGGSASSPSVAKE